MFPYKNVLVNPETGSKQYIHNGVETVYYIHIYEINETYKVWRFVRPLKASPGRNFILLWNKYLKLDRKT